MDFACQRYCRATSPAVAHRPGYRKHKSFLLRKAAKVQEGITAGLIVLAKDSMMIVISSGSVLGHSQEQ